MAALLEEGNEAVYKDLPYYNAILRSFFKRQILHLGRLFAMRLSGLTRILSAHRCVGLRQRLLFGEVFQLTSSASVVLPILKEYFNICTLHPRNTDVVIIVTSSYLQMEELASQTGEEAIILTANINNGTMSHLGTSTARGFIDGRDDIKSQFLSYCLTTHHSVSSVTSGSSSSFARSLTASMCPPPKRQRLDSSLQAPAISSSATAGLVMSHTDILETQTCAPVHKLFTSFSEAQPVKSSETRTSTSRLEGNRAGDTGEMKSEIAGDILGESAEQGSAETLSQSTNQSSSEHPQTGQSTPDITVDGTSDSSTGSAKDMLHPASGDAVIVKTEPVSDELEECEVMASWSHADMSWAGTSSTMVPTNREPVAQSAMNVYPSTTYTHGALFPRLLPPSVVRALFPDNRKCDVFTSTDLESCQVCGKVMTRPALRNHMLSHQGIRNFECEFCGKKFTHKATLMNHRRLHTGERPFRCHVCDAAFPSRSGLSQHNFSKHRF